MAIEFSDRNRKWGLDSYICHHDLCIQRIPFLLRDQIKIFFLIIFGMYSIDFRCYLSDGDTYKCAKKYHKCKSFQLTCTSYRKRHTVLVYQTEFRQKSKNIPKYEEADIQINKSKIFNVVIVIVTFTHYLNKKL